MRLGLIISLLMHMALLAWAVLTIQQTPELRLPETVTISVAVVTPSDVTRMKQGDENTKTLESKAADKPSELEAQKEVAKPKPAPAPPAATPPPPPEPEPPKPEPKKAEPEPPKPDPPKPDPIAEKLAALPPEKAPEPPPPEPAPGPTPEELAKAEAERQAAEARAKAEAEKKRKEAEAKKKAEAEKKKKLAEAKAKADAEKAKFDLDKIAKAIDQAPDAAQKALIDKSSKPAGARPQGDSKTATNTGPSAGTRDGRDTVLSAREADMLRGLLNAQLTSCWRLPAGGGGTDTPVVVLTWRLRPDGALDGEPRIVQPQNSPQFQVAAEAAIRAVKACVPFQLPPDKYQNWREIVNWEFDPRKML